jgi:hypothetical protein
VWSESQNLGYCEGFDYAVCRLLDSLSGEQMLYTPDYPML